MKKSKVLSLCESENGIKEVFEVWLWSDAWEKYEWDFLWSAVAMEGIPFGEYWIEMVYVLEIWGVLNQGI